MIDLAKFLIGIALVILAIFSAGHALLYKRDSRAALGWVAFCLFFPAAGPILYWLFGVNRVQARAREWQLKGDWNLSLQIPTADRIIQKGGMFRVGDQYATIATVSDSVAQRPLTGGNKIDILHNGEQVYPEMLDAIRNAKTSVYLCTYIFDTDQTGRKFVDALSSAAAGGCDVRVLVDGLGEFYSFPRISRWLKKARLRFSRFLPFTTSGRGLHLNLRNHRKILAIDHRTGFTGGMNIGDRHLASSASRRRVVDMHFRLEGPVVAHLEDTFVKDWYFATGETLLPGTVDYRSTDSPALCRGISAGPNEDFEKLYWIILNAITAAKTRIRIMTPYFVPDRNLLSAINMAALRGVSVEILLPEKNNLPYVAWAAQAILWEVLLYGSRVYFQPSPFVHSKYLIVDDAYGLVGSANMDARSLRLNFEFNVEIFDTDFVQGLSKHFDDVRNRSRTVTFLDIEGRPLWMKLRDGTAKLFSPYL